MPRIDHSRLPHRRRCRTCGSRRIDLIWDQPAKELAKLTVADAEAAAGKLRWQCRRCGTSMRYQPADATLWQRRRPLASWLFGR